MGKAASAHWSLSLPPNGNSIALYARCEWLSESEGPSGSVKACLERLSESGQRTRQTHCQSTSPRLASIRVSIYAQTHSTCPFAPASHSMGSDDDEDEGGVPLGSLDLSEAKHSDNEEPYSGLRSNIARNQDQLVDANPLPREQADKESRRKRPRNEYIRKRAVREELYNHSLLALEDHTRSRISSEAMGQILGIGQEKSIQDLMSSVSAFEEDKMLRSLKPQALTHLGDAHTFSTWLVFELLMCRNMALSVYANCKTLQANNLAGDYYSILTLCEASTSNRPNVVSLKRIPIDGVQGLAESLVRATRVLPSLIFAETSVQGTDDMPTLLALEFLLLMHTFGSIHTRCNTIFAQLGLFGLVTELELETFQKRLTCGKSEPSTKEIDYFSALFTRWRSILEILDFGILAYEGAHVSRFDQHIFGSNINSFAFPERSLSFLPFAQSRAQEETSVYFCRLRMNCLAGLMGNNDVWVLGRAADPPAQALYLASDIETFADVYGPVWKVMDPSRPGYFTRYNVGGGSIVPWLWDSGTHPNLEAGERLCHWRKNDEYVTFKAVNSSENSEYKSLTAAN